MNIHHWRGSLRSQATKIPHRLGFMRARADHESLSLTRIRKAFLHKIRSHYYFGELLSLGSLRLHRPTWPSIATFHDVFSTASTRCACLRDSFQLVPRMTFKFLQLFSNIHHRSCLPIAAIADIHHRFGSLRSPGSRCIPMGTARFQPLAFCLHGRFLLVPRLTT